MKLSITLVLASLVVATTHAFWFDVEVDVNLELVYTTMATYYGGLAECREHLPAGCEDDLYSVTQLDSGCYDEAYKECADEKHSNMMDTVSSDWDFSLLSGRLIWCYGECKLGDLTCYETLYKDGEGDDCINGGIALRFTKLFNALDDCPDQCNLLKVCGGGGTDCVTKEKRCTKCFKRLD